MANRLTQWDAFDPHDWAKLLGLVHVSLFGEGGPSIPGAHAVLLDGTKASFSISSSDDERLFTDDSATSWSWSSHVRHAVILNPSRRKMFLRRWDEPSVIRQFQLPTPSAAEDLILTLYAARSPKTPSVIERIMQIFRQLRRTVGSPVSSLKALNALLLAARAVSIGATSDAQLRKARTLQDVATFLDSTSRHAIGLDNLSNDEKQTAVTSLVEYLLNTDPETRCRLHADLLFRHAASQLYQEAHFELERGGQMYFAGFEPEPALRGPRDARYTPANLARALVQQALNRLPSLNTRSHLVALDPACGSGIFLQECFREIAAGATFTGELSLIGIDTSEVSESISSSCLNLAQIETTTHFKIKASILRRDALEMTWPEADLILMNPPFQAWQDMSNAEQQSVTAALGNVAKGRPDKAFAFLWRAVKSLKPGGVLAAVLPGPLLDNRSGLELREALSAEADLLAIGRFEGFSYFASSLVETAFLVLRKRESVASAEPTTVLIASEGSEDFALRVLRGATPPTKAETQVVELFAVPSSSFRAGSWLPRRRADLLLLQTLDSLGLPTVSELFDVHQGIRTGSKKAFLLTAEEHSTLPKAERKFFRKAAGQGTLRKGVLQNGEYVFFPYDANGSTLPDEVRLVKAVPAYFERWLSPRKEELAARAKVDKWWLPTWPRNWQYELRQKIVSTYFGRSGSFAFDDAGDFVVVEGFAWLWTKELRDEDQELIDFAETTLPFAYLALLNSTVFERILSCFSWRLQGGQFRLEPRFLKSLPMLDLSNEERIPRSLLEALVAVGRQIHAGKLEEALPEGDRATAAAYGIPQILD